MGIDEFKQIGHWISAALKSHDNQDALARIHADVQALASSFPVPAERCATGAEPNSCCS
jgi:glycine/serine hydroxymethyltransferase